MSTPQPSASTPTPSGSQQTTSTAQYAAYPLVAGQQPQVQSQQGSSDVKATRAATAEARKDKSLAEFMLMLDDYEPLVRFL
jgi:transcription initiation factor TFIID subunit 10